MSRNRCRCGRRHERIQFDTGVTVVGCPVCLAEPEALRALTELVRAAVGHAEALRKPVTVVEPPSRQV